MVVQMLRRVMVAVLAVAACGGDAVDPAAVIEDYAAAYNAGDIDAVMALFSEESVVRGHPFATESTGLDAIRTVQIADIAAAASVDAYAISNVQVAGDTVTWDHVWENGEGSFFCQQGHTAVVEDGAIKSWTWPDDDFDCPPDAAP